MKLLFDQNLSFKLCNLLSRIYPGSQQAARLGLSLADDIRLWEAAKSGGYILVSQDADFAEMALLRGAPPKVIWLRCGNRPTSYIAELLMRHRHRIADFEINSDAACLEIYG